MGWHSLTRVAGWLTADDTGALIFTPNKATERHPNNSPEAVMRKRNRHDCAKARATKAKTTRREANAFFEGARARIRGKYVTGWLTVDDTGALIFTPNKAKDA